MADDSTADQWSIDVSDDEKYGGNLIRQGRITKWEPSPSRIAFLYQQLEKNGSLDLKWKCPGRRSPSVHSPAGGNNVLERNKINSADSTKQSNLLATEFDFDEKFGDSTPTSTVTSVNRRKTVNQGSRKVAKLENVMNNLKKYQIMDSQTKKTTNLTNAPSTPTVTSSTTIVTTVTTPIPAPAPTPASASASASASTPTATSTPTASSTITTTTSTSGTTVTVVEMENVKPEEPGRDIQMDSK